MICLQTTTPNPRVARPRPLFWNFEVKEDFFGRTPPRITLTFLVGDDAEFVDYEVEHDRFLPWCRHENPGLADDLKDEALRIIAIARLGQV